MRIKREKCGRCFFHWYVRTLNIRDRSKKGIKRGGRKAREGREKAESNEMKKKEKIYKSIFFALVGTEILLCVLELWTLEEEKERIEKGEERRKVKKEKK